jgi:hypothetical protein
METGSPPLFSENSKFLTLRMPMLITTESKEGIVEYEGELTVSEI